MAVIDNDLAAELDALAVAIARMRPPQNHNPHAFHEDRSELASRARSIAQRVRTGPAPKPAAKQPEPPISGRVRSHETRHIDGRTVLVLTRGAAAGVR
jgi:hypothetical protein